MSTEFRIIKENMRNMLKYSKLEYAEYKKTQDIILLQQAGEKLFNAIENYIEDYYQVKVDSFYELTNLTKERELRDLLYKGRELHRFFYNAENEYDVRTAEIKYNQLLTKVERKIR